MRLNLFFLFLLLSLTVSAQKRNAISYYECVNKAQLEICDSNIGQAFEWYCRAFQTGCTPFSKDLNNALVCALELNKTENAEYFFKRLLSRGLHYDYLKFYLQSKDSNDFRKWLSVYPNNIEKLNHPFRGLVNELVKKDQDVRSYFLSLHSDGNYMQDSVFKVDSSNASILYSELKKYGGTFPNEDIIGNNFGSPAFSILIQHYLGRGVVGRPSDLFDSLLLASVFSLNLHPADYVAIVSGCSSKWKDNTFYCQTDTLYFPITIYVGRYMDELRPEYFPKEEENRRNRELAKIGLPTLDEMRKKLFFQHRILSTRSSLSKYAMPVEIAGFLGASSIEELNDWDKINQPFKH